MGFLFEFFIINLYCNSASYHEKIKKMITYYNRKDLVSFGNYLLSEERKDLFASHPDLGSTNLTSRLSLVHDSDIENWKVKATARKLSNNYKPEIEHEE